MLKNCEKCKKIYSTTARRSTWTRCPDCVPKPSATIRALQGAVAGIILSGLAVAGGLGVYVLLPGPPNEQPPKEKTAAITPVTPKELPSKSETKTVVEKKQPVVPPESVKQEAKEDRQKTITEIKEAMKKELAEEAERTRQEEEKLVIELARKDEKERLEKFARHEAMNAMAWLPSIKSELDLREMALIRKRYEDYAKRFANSSSKEIIQYLRNNFKTDALDTVSWPNDNDKRMFLLIAQSRLHYYVPIVQPDDEIRLRAIIDKITQCLSDRNSDIPLSVIQETAFCMLKLEGVVPPMIGTKLLKKQ
jgi:hypothetical protein